MRSNMNLLEKLLFYVMKIRVVSLCIPSGVYLRILYRLAMGKKLNLKNPSTFNEKLQWLKLYNKNKNYVRMVCKLNAKAYVKEIIGEEYIIPTLGVWERFDSIEFEQLPSQFVLKTTHDSGGVVICKDKESFDFINARKKLSSSLKRNYYLQYREWPYKDVKPLIIAEPYLEDQVTRDLRDYKFFCFDGYVDCVMVCIDRQIQDTKYYFFDKDWILKRINKRGLDAPEDFTLDKPTKYDDMIKIAMKLSKGIPFVRVDLYECDDRIYFGELTFFPQSGLDPNLLPETDAYFGRMIKLN